MALFSQSYISADPTADIPTNLPIAGVGKVFPGVSAYISATPSNNHVETDTLHNFFRSSSYAEDYIYNRIWLTRLISLGSINEDRVEPISLWNTFYEQQILISTDADVPGQTYIVESVPIVLEPLTEYTLTLQADWLGDSYVTATYEFITDTGYTLVMYVTGFRVIPFLWEHNWKSGFNEKLSWVSTLSTAYDGTEQRASLRPVPRRTYTFNFIVSGYESELVHTYLAGRKTNYFAIPIWHDLSFTQAVTAKDSYVIYVDTIGKTYTVGSKVFVFVDNKDYDLLTILEVNSDHLIVEEPINMDYLSGVRVSPAEIFQLDGDVSVTNHARGVIEFTINIIAINAHEVTQVYTPELYKDIEVFPSKLNFKASNDTMRRKWDYLDTGLSLPTFIKESIEPQYTSSYAVANLSRSEVAIFYQFIHSCLGIVVPFWILSKANNLVPTLGWLLGASDITINYAAYAGISFGEASKKNIEIHYTDGTFSRHEITDCYYNPAVSSTTETITVSPTLPDDREPEEILFIAYLQLARLNSDSISLKWEATGINSCGFSVKILN